MSRLGMPRGEDEPSDFELRDDERDEDDRDEDAERELEDEYRRDCMRGIEREERGRR